METKRTVGDYGINWMWYVEFTDHGDGSATVHRHWRVHKDDECPTAELCGYEFREERGRVAVALKVPEWNGDTFTLRNPGYVFDLGTK